MITIYVKRHWYKCHTFIYNFYLLKKRRKSLRLVGLIHSYKVLNRSMPPTSPAWRAFTRVLSRAITAAAIVLTRVDGRAGRHWQFLCAVVSCEPGRALALVWVDAVHTHSTLGAWHLEALVDVVLTVEPLETCTSPMAGLYFAFKRKKIALKDNF